MHFHIESWRRWWQHEENSMDTHHLRVLNLRDTQPRWSGQKITGDTYQQECLGNGIWEMTSLMTVYYITFWFVSFSPKLTTNFAETGPSLPHPFQNKKVLVVFGDMKRWTNHTMKNNFGFRDIHFPQNYMLKVDRRGRTKPQPLASSKADWRINHHFSGANLLLELRSVMDSY